MTNITNEWLLAPKSMTLIRKSTELFPRVLPPLGGWEPLGGQPPQPVFDCHDFYCCSLRSTRQDPQLPGFRALNLDVLWFNGLFNGFLDLK